MNTNNSPYYNQPIKIDGKNFFAIKIAANRLMPPQYQEFIAAIGNAVGMSETTKAYWQEKYEMFCEWANEQTRPDNHLEGAYDERNGDI